MERLANRDSSQTITAAGDQAEEKIDAAKRKSQDQIFKMKRYCEQMGVECSDDEEDGSADLKEAKEPMQETESVVRQQLTQGFRMQVGGTVALLQVHTQRSQPRHAADTVVLLDESSPEETARAAMAEAVRNLADNKDELGDHRRKAQHKQYKAAVAQATADEVTQAEKLARKNLQETEESMAPLQQNFQKAQQVFEKDTKLRVSLDDVAADKEAEQLHDEASLNQDREKLDEVQIKLSDATEKRSNTESQQLVQALKDKDFESEVQIAKANLDAAVKKGHHLGGKVERLQDHAEKAQQQAVTKDAIWQKAEAQAAGAKKSSELAG